MIVVEKEDENGFTKECWTKPITNYLGNSKLPGDTNVAKKLRLKAARYA